MSDPADAAPLAPQDLESERALLGGLILDNSTIAEVADLLSPADFFLESHRPIYQALSDALTDGKSVDLIILKDMLRRSGHLEKCGGADYLVKLLDETPTAAHARWRAEQIKEAAIKRGIIDAADEFRSGAMNGRTAAEVLSSHRVRVDDLEREVGGGALKTFTAAEVPNIDFPALTPILGPNLLSRGCLFFLAGAPGTHKTYAMLDLLLMVARGGGGQWLGQTVAPEPSPVLWLFGEGGGTRVKERLLQMTKGENLPERLEFYVPPRYALDLCDAADVGALRNKIRSMKERHKTDHIILAVDPLAKWARYDQNSEADRVLWYLDSFCREGVTVAIVHHTNKPREGFQKGDANNMRGDSRLLGAANTVLMFDREGEGEFRASWAKHNDAPEQDPIIIRFDSDDTYRLKVVAPAKGRVHGYDAMMQVLYDAGTEWVLKATIVQQSGQSQRSVERHLSKAVKSGQVERDGPESGALSRYRVVQSWEVGG